MWVVAPQPLFSRRVVKSKEHGFVDAESLAREPEFFDADRPQVGNRPHGGMRLAGFAIGGAGERNPYSAVAEVCEHTTVKDLIVGMRQYD
jgi:hypothetical protein